MAPCQVEHVVHRGRLVRGQRGRRAHEALHLREPFRTLSERLNRRLAERGHEAVRPAHGAVFQFLDDGGTRVAVLAERAQIAKQSMAELVAHLERHGYVERIPDPDDGRAKLVRSTRRGGQVFAVARELVSEVEQELSARLGTAKMARLRALLEELGEALEPR